MSVGFHYFETVQQSLSLQWLPKNEAPRQLGRIIAAGSFATIAAYALIFLTWKLLHLDFSSVYLAGGGATVLLAIGGMVRVSKVSRSGAAAQAPVHA